MIRTGELYTYNANQRLTPLPGVNSGDACLWFASESRHLLPPLRPVVRRRACRWTTPNCRWTTPFLLASLALLGQRRREPRLEEWSTRFPNHHRTSRALPLKLLLCSMSIWLIIVGHLNRRLVSVIRSEQWSLNDYCF